MANYIELHTLRGSESVTALRQKISVAIAIKSNAIAKLPTPTVEQKTFAKAALAHPDNYQELVLNYILAEYNSQTTATIVGATDAQVQAAVDSTINTLLGV